MSLERGRGGQFTHGFAWQGQRPVDARRGVAVCQRLFGERRNALSAAAQAGLARYARRVGRTVRMLLIRKPSIRRLGTASGRGAGRSVLHCPKAAAKRLRAGEHQHAEKHR